MQFEIEVVPVSSDAVASAGWRERGDPETDNMTDITPTIRAIAAAKDCTFCSETVGDDHYFLYVTPEPPLEFTIPGASRKECILCEDCGDRVLDLAHSWTRTPDHSGEMVTPHYRVYSEPADECSSCNEPLEHPILGVGIALRPLTSADIDARYTLCSSCIDVFRQFLEMEFKEARSR